VSVTNNKIIAGKSVFVLVTKHWLPLAGSATACFASEARISQLQTRSEYHSLQIATGIFENHSAAAKSRTGRTSSHNGDLMYR
jgi:hypothetical protein